ncbi:MAG TPA: glucosidase, partial [Candidatus Dormibacteraeota bacterium]|nr:glucosidase [Candidatus Dormibacteraeota bacterium]
NIGVFDRSSALPTGGHLDQSDGTAWMGMYALNMMVIALELARENPTYEDVATKFFEHFAYIADAINSRGLWDEEDGLYHDVLHTDDGNAVPIRARSIVGLIPLLAVTVLPAAVRNRLPDFSRRMDFYLSLRPEVGALVEHIHVVGEQDNYLLSILTPDQLRRVVARLLDEAEFLSPHGVRSLSRFHRDHPLRMDVGGGAAVLDYEPGESTSGLFGGNSNWRGPVWFPINYLLVRALRRFHAYVGDGFEVECPTGSGRLVTLVEASDEIARRLASIFLDDDCGRRPVFGDRDLFQRDPAWHDLIPFHEYFHGDTGAGLGASHQTGWTGLVANLLVERGRQAANPGEESGRLAE